MTLDSTDISKFGYDRNTPKSVATFGYLNGSSLPDILNYCQQARDRLAEQFKNSELLQGLLCVLLEEIQELQFVFQDLKINRAVDTAVGVTSGQLYQLALIVGASISGMTDAEARAAIRSQIAINVSNGEPETVIDFVKSATDATFILYKEVYPAKINIFTDGGTTPIGLNGLIQSVAPAGVGVEVVSSYGDPTPFAVEPEGGIPDPNGLGFGEINLPDEGGRISERIIN